MKVHLHPHSGDSSLIHSSMQAFVLQRGLLYRPPSVLPVLSQPEKNRPPAVHAPGIALGERGSIGNEFTANRHLKGRLERGDVVFSSLVFSALLAFLPRLRFFLSKAGSRISFPFVCHLVQARRTQVNPSLNCFASVFSFLLRFPCCPTQSEVFRLFFITASARTLAE